MSRMKAEMKERTLKRFLLSQKHIVYTEPLDVHAGSTVTVFYNPANTVLNGKPEVWFRCSFNRWTHCVGPLPPQRMLPADNGSHVKATGKFSQHSWDFELYRICFHFQLQLFLFNMETKLFFIFSIAPCSYHEES